jgi:hypothetical protein
MSYELGVEVDRGAPPLHRTLYVRVMPRLTISNRSGLTLQVGRPFHARKRKHVHAHTDTRAPRYH